MSTNGHGESPAQAYLDPEAVAEALARTPHASYVMTSAFELARAGVVVSWVQRCAQEPLLVSVALRKGHAIEMLIRDSRCFALSLIAEDDQAILRRFEENDASPLNVFETLETETLATGAPCLKRAVLAIDCEVHRHFDVEADCEIYVGLVREARMYSKPQVAVRRTRRRTSAAEASA